jgi:hypothetical protein
MSIKDTTIKIFNRSLRIAILFSKQQESSINELGHYVIDNLVGKIAMAYLEQLNPSFIFINPNSKRTKDFPVLIDELFDAKYNLNLTVDKQKIKDQHKKRNYFQHGFDSFDFRLDEIHTKEYVEIATQLMKDLKILDIQSIDISDFFLKEKKEQILNVNEWHEKRIKEVKDVPPIKFDKSPYFVLSIIPYSEKDINHNIEFKKREDYIKWSIKSPFFHFLVNPREPIQTLDGCQINYFTENFEDPIYYILLFNNGSIEFGGYLHPWERENFPDVEIRNIVSLISEFLNKTEILSYLNEKGLEYPFSVKLTLHDIKNTFDSATIRVYDTIHGRTKERTEKYIMKSIQPKNEILNFNSLEVKKFPIESSEIENFTEQIYRAYKIAEKYRDLEGYLSNPPYLEELFEKAFRGDYNYD